MCSTLTKTAIHPFEESGLGKAPYRYVGTDTLAVDASADSSLRNRYGPSRCDHCTTPIRDHYYVLSSDNKLFAVGCACIDKVTATGKCKLPDDIKKLKNAKMDTRIANARKLLESDAIRAELASKPHYQPWAQAKGLTMLDCVEWLLSNGGRTGKTDAAKMVEKAAKAAG